MTVQCTSLLYLFYIINSVPRYHQLAYLSMSLNLKLASVRILHRRVRLSQDIDKGKSTVILGYNDHGYNEFTVKLVEFFGPN